MMTENKKFDNTNKGALFTNKNKQKETHPDLTGFININGVEHWLSCWVNSSHAGTVYSLAIGDKKEPAAPKQYAQQTVVTDHLDDEVPF